MPPPVNSPFFLHIYFNVNYENFMYLFFTLIIAVNAY